MLYTIFGFHIYLRRNKDYNGLFHIFVTFLYALFWGLLPSYPNNSFYFPTFSSAGTFIVSFFDSSSTFFFSGDQFKLITVNFLQVCWLIHFNSFISCFIHSHNSNYSYKLCTTFWCVVTEFFGISWKIGFPGLLFIFVVLCFFSYSQLQQPVLSIFQIVFFVGTSLHLIYCFFDFFFQIPSILKLIPQLANLIATFVLCYSFSELVHTEMLALNQQIYIRKQASNFAVYGICALVCCNVLLYLTDK
jgi:hypothetical protein